MDSTRLMNFITESQEAHLKATRDIAAQEAILNMKAKGATEEQMAVEKAVLDYRNSALERGIDINNEAYRIAENLYRIDQARTAEIDKQTKLLDRGQAVWERLNPQAVTATRYADDRAGLAARYNGGANDRGYTLEAYQSDIAKINKAEIAEKKEAEKALRDAALDKWGDTVDSVADVFGGRFSQIADDFANMVSSLKGDSGIGGMLKGVGLFDEFDGTFKKWFGKDSQLGGMFNKLFGENGTMFKNLGKTIGQMGAGAQVGEMANGVMNMLGIKGSKTGAMIGGAAGSFAGPIGSIVGSIAGNVIGGIFKKAKYGSASIAQMADGQLGVGSLTGNNKDMKGGANSAAGAVISGIEEIAAQLGATITGTPSVSIGQYKGKWRVSDIGRTGKLKGGSGRSDIHDFGEDGAEAAIAFAIQTALQDGILTGISDFSKRIIQANGDEKALSLATSYESILDSLAKFNNPIKGAVEDAVKDLDTLAKQMKAAGASAAELGNLEQYRSLKLKELMEEQMSDFTDTLKMLKGEASGKSPLALLNEDMADLNKFRETILNGGTVDSAAFNTLVQDIAGQAGDIWGSQTSAYQNLIRDMTDLTSAAQSNAASEFERAATGAEGTTAAVEQTTQAINTSNDLLADIRDLLASNAGSVQRLRSAANGQLLNPS